MERSFLFSWGFGRLGMNADYKRIMRIQIRVSLTIASLAFVLASWLPNEVSAAELKELKEAQVTQVIRDVRPLPSNASPRPASRNDRVHEDTAVPTGGGIPDWLTFTDKTLTRLGSQIIFSFNG